jgi:hypothetical protein
MNIKTFNKIQKYIYLIFLILVFLFHQYTYYIFFTNYTIRYNITVVTS